MQASLRVFCAYHSSRESRLLTQPAFPRCMLSPDTPINKQRCCAASRQNKRHTLASELAGMPFILPSHFVTAVYLSCAWLVITHIQLIILYIVFFYSFDSKYSVLLLLFRLLSIVSVENATILQQSISELFSFHFCCLFNSHFFSNYQNRHFLHNLTRFFIILCGNRDSYQIVCRVYIAILNFHMFS